ncbi:MAG: hypothetical protein RL757_100 [Bacteroidota bacterium]|jgi:uncharacterized membrane protein (UPF0127 family)
MNRKVLTFFVGLALVAMIVPSVIGFFSDISGGIGGGTAPGVTPSSGVVTPTPPTTEAVRVSQRDKNNPSSAVPEQPFLHEGELSFVGKNGKEIQKVEMEVADDDLQREQGLMFRRKMLPSRAMLFLFDQEEKQAFWMRNTYIPLDIIYVNSTKTIVSIQKNAAILNDNPLPSNAPANMVVEVVGGFCDKNGVKVGDKIDFKRD